MTYARQKKYSWYAFKAALTKDPFVFAAHELSQSSPEELVVFSNCTYTATLLGKPFTPGETEFNYNIQHGIAGKFRKKPRSEADKINNLTITLPDGTRIVKLPAKRLAKINLALDTEGLAPVADGGDLVAVTATLADIVGTPKRYLTETIRFSVKGEADIVGENPQTTRWGEAVVLIRPRAAATPKPIVVCAETVRHGKYAPSSGELVFTPGSPEVKTATAAAGGDEARLRKVEAEQHAFEMK
jgi:beta-galactosidase